MHHVAHAAVHPPSDEVAASSEQNERELDRAAQGAPHLQPLLVPERARYDQSDEGLPAEELSSSELEDSEQDDAGPTSPALGFAARAAALASMDGKVIHVSRETRVAQHLVSPTLARGPPGARGAGKPSLADARADSLFVSSVVLSS